MEGDEDHGRQLRHRAAACVGRSGRWPGLVFRAGPGLYAISFIAIVIVVWNLWDAWVLLMGVADEEIDLEAH